MGKWVQGKAWTHIQGPIINEVSQRYRNTLSILSHKSRISLKEEMELQLTNISATDALRGVATE